MTHAVQDPDYEARVAKRKANKVPLPYSDDESVEHNTAFSVFLTSEQQAEVRGTADMLEKRRLIAKYTRQFASEDDD